jgi:proline iminopeptidase
VTLGRSFARVAVALSMLCASHDAVASSAGLLSVGPHRVKTGDVTISYRVAGNGPLLVVLSPDWGIGSAYLQSGLRPLEASHRMVYVDERGSGGSSRPLDPGRMGFRDMARDLEQLRRVWRVQRLDLIGHSAGGTIAMEYAREEAGHVDRMILVDAQLNGFDTGALHARFKDRWRRDPAHAAAVAHYDDAAPRTDAAFAGYLRRTVGWYLSDPARFGAAVRSGLPARLPVWTLLNNARADAREARERGPELSRILARTLVTVGRDDAECPVEMSQAIHAGIRGSDLVVYERDGHFPWVEASADFFRDVETFLSAKG